MENVKLKTTVPLGDPKQFNNKNLQKIVSVYSHQSDTSLERKLFQDQNPQKFTIDRQFIEDKKQAVPQQELQQVTVDNNYNLNSNNGGLAAQFLGMGIQEPSYTEFPRYAPVQGGSSQVMSRRPKLTDNIKLIEKVMRRQNQTQQDSRHQIPLIPVDSIGKSEVRKPQVAPAAKSTLLSKVHQESPGIGDTPTTSSNSIQGHYMSDRIEKTIQKFSKKQIIKNNSPFLNSNGGKSRNFNQSNSASKIYCATFKSIAVKNQSPYMNNNGIYQTQMCMKEQDSDEQEEQTLNHFEMSADKNINDLSFESLNPINNSFTDGMKSKKEPVQLSRVQVSIGNHNQYNNHQSNQISNQVHIKSQFQKIGKPRFLDSTPTNQNPNNYHDQMISTNLEDSLGGMPSNSFISHPNAHWWSQQMYPQPLIAPGTASHTGSRNIFEAHQLYQLPQYPSSVHASPFQQSKSRDGGYRNIPIRDLSSISEQSPHKANDNLNNSDISSHPFKGPKLHLFKKGNSRRIKTSSATRGLQPIYHLDSSKLALNFQSIHTGSATTAHNDNESAHYYQNKSPNFDIEQENQYQTLTQGKDNYRVQPGRRNLNPLNSNHHVTNIGGTLDVYANEDQSYGNYVNAQNIQLLKLNHMRPNTTSLDQLDSQSPKQRQQFNIGKVNPLEPKHGVQGLSKLELQEEINGFKHSFYNDRSTPTKKQELGSVVITNNPDSARQIEKMKEQIHQNSEAIKHIFVLNVNNQNLTTNQQSTQESKAMTPCFIHTPNMTNKWGNFKPEDQDALEEKEEPQESFFVKDKTIKVMPQTKKPLTSHTSKNQSMTSGPQNIKPKPKDKQESIKLGPEDIYLTNGSKSSKNHTGIKPQTSSSTTFRIPLSRNQALTSASTHQTQLTSFTNAVSDPHPTDKPNTTGNKKHEILKDKMSSFKITKPRQPPQIKEQTVEDD